MRVLILTHPRSGGMSLLQYIKYELGYEEYHEPFFNNDNGLTEEQINRELFLKDNIIVKDFPFRIVEKGFNVGDVITASLNIESREYNGRWYTDARAWKIQGQGAGGTSTDTDPFHPDNEPNFTADSASDDLPF